MKTLSESILINLKEDTSAGYNLESFLPNYEYPPEIAVEEVFNNDSDRSYFTVVRTVSDAEKFNYHSDYWGTAEEYQDNMVDLLSTLEPYIEDKTVFNIDGFEEFNKATITGVAIDRQYNSMSHAKILVVPVVNEGKKIKSKKLKSIKESVDVSTFEVGSNSPYLKVICDLAKCTPDDISECYGYVFNDFEPEDFMLYMNDGTAKLVNTNRNSAQSFKSVEEASKYLFGDDDNYIF